MGLVAAAAGAAISWVGGIATAAQGVLSAGLLAAGLGKASWAAAGFIVSTAGQLAASVALTALMQPQTGAGGSPTAFKADPSAPISGVMGRFGVGGRQLHGNVWGKGNLYLSFATGLSLGPIDSVVSFKANDTTVTFPGPQGLAASVEPYKDKMWMTYRLGLPGDAALSPPSGVSDGSPSMSEWTSNHKAPMLAHSFWTLKNNSKRASYESGVPRPLWTLLGMKVWDPRLDSTYPGGSGTQLRDDWTTWAYSENPYLHALAWVRGHHKLETDGSIDRTKRLAGVGAPDAAIDIASFVEGANVADANSWVISGEWTTSDDKWQTLAAMLQAGGGVPLNRGAQIGCMVNTPRASILTVTQEDIVGPVRIGVMASRRDRPNTIIPRYRSEPHKFEEVPAGAVSSTTYVDADRGETRTREVSYRFVRVAKQAAELAAYDLANARETLRPTIPTKPYMLGLRAGDAFTVEAAETGLNGQKMVLMRRPFDPASAVVTLECRSETDAKHAWALGQSANPPEDPSLGEVDQTTPPPEAGEWTAVSGTITGDDGAELPAIVVTGSVASEVADQVIFEYRRSGATDWTPVGTESPEVERKQIVGLAPGDWEVAVSYRANRNTSTRLVLDPVTLGGLIVPLTPDVLDDGEVVRRPGGFGGYNFTGDLDAVGPTYVDNSVGTLENELIDGTVRPLALEQGASVKLGATTAAPVQAQSYVMQAGDAETVSFDTPYDTPPVVIPYGVDNLLALENPGDYYKTSPVSVTTTGFTGRARRINPGTGGTLTSRTDDGAANATGTPGTEQFVIHRNKALSGVAHDNQYLASFSVATKSSPLLAQRTMVVGFYGRRVSAGAWTLLGQKSIQSSPSTSDLELSSHTITGEVDWTTWPTVTGSGTDGYEYKLEALSGSMSGAMYLTEFASVEWTEASGATGASDVTALSTGAKMNYLVIPQTSGSLSAP